VEPRAERAEPRVRDFRKKKLKRVSAKTRKIQKKPANNASNVSPQKTAK
jgi:hypothetical protein